jgi:two-component system, NarL family, response regulator NreC
VPRNTHLAVVGAAQSDGALMPARVRVVLAEDHATMRRSLTLLLEAEPDIRVVAECGKLEAALDQVGSYRPDVLVLDLRMPEGSSFDLVRRLHAVAPSTGIVMITMHEGQAFARYAHQAGALGFVLKDSADVELAEAVRCAARGERYTSPRVDGGVVHLHS